MATIAAAGATVAQVQAAIDLASTGDTVTVPAGTETWASGITISGKNITVQGAGDTLTIITGNCISWGETSSRITGFRFNDTSLSAAHSGSGFRLDHCTLYSASTARTISLTGTLLAPCPNGLIDNCTLYNVRVVVEGYAESNKTEQEDPDQYAHYQWVTALALGTNNAVYVEDCICTRTDANRNAVDSGPGGRYVFR